MAQISPVYAIEAIDINDDQKTDLILGGNLFAVKPEMGRYDASYGSVLLGDGLGDFTPVNALTSGVSVPGQTRHIAVIKNRNELKLLFVRNADTIKLYKVKK